MNITDLIEQRQQSWSELDILCNEVSSRTRRSVGPQQWARFAALYRAACADLALAEAWQLPPDTVRYLHTLVGRAHNQLYRSRRIDPAAWYKSLSETIPRAVFGDPYIIIGFLAFFGIFLLSAYIAYDPVRAPEFADNMVGAETLEGIEQMHAKSTDRDFDQGNLIMVSFYGWHNTSIGLKCFASGLLGFPGLMITIFNASYLGAIFGYMARPENLEKTHFFGFVTAHGPFELTAIALSAGAGLRLGGAWIDTKGLDRADSMFKTAREMLPVVGIIILLFCMAGVIEGCVSPTRLPYPIKAFIAVVSTVVLVLYFGVLGGYRWWQEMETK